ncbi:hypothetical protein GGTG_05544 [Gaeumannomyces tritici R3-111a-1]|uniref:Uncharacterized protein n=1 Tax=Gaeumannomyces tritici (strain R3-111a-1) TaxID=644352 RepID=J3NW79_GAET3|nr:hypothetical protein GGTG_05544 [Gaeumannomyces tritici R3-111a-1]EJT75611.1 hypothetical protein GGTG_05544 [Gaeumannomyces tritici R3-111a-1]
MANLGIPNLPPDYTPSEDQFAQTIDTRHWIRYRKWNFVIFRGTYNDNALWAKFITLLKGEYANHMENRACLDSITVTRDEWHRGPGIHWQLQGQVVLIDGTHGHHDKDDRHLIPAELDEDGNPRTDEEYEPLEGNINWDVGWTYIDAGHLTVYYEDLHFQGTDWETWEMVYDRKRPSAEGPKRETGEPLASFDLPSSGEY